MAWTNPLSKPQLVVGTRSEVTPFVFRDRLYRLENFMRFHDFNSSDPQYRFHEDGFRIRDVASDRIVSIPLLNHYFSVPFVWDDRVYVFAGDYEKDRPWWAIRNTKMLWSNDLITWTKPQVVMQAEGEERIYNYGICHARDKFYMLYETNDSRWPQFTLRFAVSDDLMNWSKLSSDHIYGTDKYTGGPALYYDHEQDWFYCLYLQHVNPCYETRITRSKDLISWQDAPEDRPVVTPDPNRDVDSNLWPGIKECSASDLELCQFQGKTHVYWINGDQQGASSEYYATFDGTQNQFLRAFFE